MLSSGSRPIWPSQYAWTLMSAIEKLLGYLHTEVKILTSTGARDTNEIRVKSPGKLLQMLIREYISFNLSLFHTQEIVICHDWN